MRHRSLDRRLVFISAGVLVVMVAIVLVNGKSWGLFGTSVGQRTVSVHQNGQVPGIGLFPDVNLSGGADDSAPPVKVAWKPINVKPGACVDSILYHTNLTGSWDIFRLGPVPGKPNASPNVSKGSGPDVVDLSPSRSPDGQWVAFSSNRDGNWEIYVAAIDGSMVQRVTYNTTAADLSPMWSPDGKFITYETTRYGSRDIMEVSVATREETRLTTSPANDVNPYWSPDSKSLLYQSDAKGLWQIFQLDVTTKKSTLISDGTGNDHNPQYSPDGKQIAFRSYRAGDNSVVYAMNADGSSPHAISDPKANAANQVWSPDSTLLAYQTEMNAKLNIYVTDMTTMTTRKVTDDTTQNYAPTWSCASSMLVYTSDNQGYSNIFETAALPLNADPITPAQATQLTSDKAADQYPLNSPSVEDASHRGRIGEP